MMDIIYNDTTQKWELKKEPYMTIEVASEEDYDYLVGAVNKQQAMAIWWDPDCKDYCCPKCFNVHYIKNVDGRRNKFCGNCGQKLDWSENNGMD